MPLQMSRTENVKDQEALENRTKSHDTDYKEIQMSEGLVYIKTLKAVINWVFKCLKKCMYFVH